MIDIYEIPTLPTYSLQTSSPTSGGLWPLAAHLLSHVNVSLQNVRMLNILNFVSIFIIHFIPNSIIHDNTCKLIYKKSRYKSCYSDIKYHMTLNTRFSVLGTMCVLDNCVWQFVFVSLEDLVVYNNG